MDAFSRPTFSQRFLNVCQQLEALQPISIPTAPASSSSSSSPQQRASSDKDPLSPTSSSGHQQRTNNYNSLTLPSRERIFQIFASNERFRPSEEMLLASHKDETLRACSTATPSSSASAVVANLKSPRRSVVGLPETPEARKDRKAPTQQQQQQQSNAVHVPVGGKARVLPSQSLQRARAALKKRSNALANLQPAAMGTLPADKRRALHSAPESTWEVLRNLPGTPGAQPNGNGSSSLGLSTITPPGKQALIAELVNKTNFSTQSIFQMSRKFKIIAGSAKSVISFDEFRQIMSDDVGGLLLSIGISNGTSGGTNSSTPVDTNEDGEEEILVQTTADMTAIGATISSSETFLRRLFLTFDVDGDGKIDFREFVVGLNGFVKGTPEKKVHALFEIYKSDDASPSSTGDRGETVAISDLLGLFQGDRHLYQELMRCVDEYFARVELRDELQPTMKEDEFVAASVAEPHLLDMVSRPVPSRRYAGEAHVREKVRAFIEQKRLNWKKLLHVHRRMVDYARCALSGGTENGRRGFGNEAGADAGLRRRSVLRLPSTPPEASSQVPSPSRSDEDTTVNHQTLAIPVADFHRILAECLSPAATGGGSSFEDEALTQSILLAYVATPREKLPSTPPTPLQQQAAQAVATATASGTQEGPDSAEGVRRERPARRACT